MDYSQHYVSMKEMISNNQAKEIFLRVPLTNQEKADIDKFIRSTGYKRSAWYRRVLLSAAGIEKAETQEANR